MFLVFKAIIQLHDVRVRNVLHDMYFPFEKYFLLLIHLLPTSVCNYFLIILTATILPVFLSCALMTFAKPPLGNNASTRRWFHSRVIRNDS